MPKSFGGATEPVLVVERQSSSWRASAESLVRSVFPYDFTYQE
jgi:hypothetical protein